MIEFQNKKKLPNRPPPNYSIQSATNSFSKSPSPAQIFAYLITGIEIIVFYSCISQIYFLIPVIVIYSILTAIVIISTFVTSFIDPSDRIVYGYLWDKFTKAQKKKNSHNLQQLAKNIEQQQYSPSSYQGEYIGMSFCMYCDSYCSHKSRHCKRCNRCVEQFDHHCIWINNCIGIKNYKSFIVMICSLFLQMTLFIIVGIIATINSSFEVLVQKIIIWIVCVPIGILGFMLFNLILLHIYLIWTQQSTFNFLVKQKKIEAMNKETKKVIQIKKKQQNQLKIQENNSGKNNTKVNNSKNSSLTERQNEEKTCHGLKIKTTQISVIHIQKNILQNSNSDNGSIEQKLYRSKKIEINRNTESDDIPMIFRNNKSLKLILGQDEVQNSEKK